MINARNFLLSCAYCAALTAAIAAMFRLAWVAAR